MCQQWLNTVFKMVENWFNKIGIVFKVSVLFLWKMKSLDDHVLFFQFIADV